MAKLTNIDKWVYISFLLFLFLMWFKFINTNYLDNLPCINRKENLSGRLYSLLPKFSWTYLAMEVPSVPWLFQGGNSTTAKIMVAIRKTLYFVMHIKVILSSWMKEFISNQTGFVFAKIKQVNKYIFLLWFFSCLGVCYIL